MRRLVVLGLLAVVGVGAACAACGAFQSDDAGGDADASSPDGPTSQVDTGAGGADGSGADGTDGGGGADSSGDAPSLPCDPTSPWAAPSPIVVGNDLYTALATLSEDELTIFYDKLVTSPSRATIYTAQRPKISAAFGAAAELAGVPLSTQDTYNPALSPDGLRMVVKSNRGGNGYHLWQSTRVSTAAAFTTPTGTGLDGPGGDSDPFVTADELWFASTRLNGELNIFHAAITGGGFGAPEAVAALNSTSPDHKPVVSRDGLTVFFASSRPGSAAEDIWTSTRKTKLDTFAVPTPVAELNTAADDIPTWISADSCRLYLTTGRAPFTALTIMVSSRSR